MNNIDKDIYVTNKAICDNIEYFGDINRGLLSQNILAQVRNFVEYIAIKEYSGNKDADSNNYDLRKKSLEFLKQQGKLRFLSRFHDLLQVSVSHYTEDVDGSERLMLKYYEYLMRIKEFMKTKHNMIVLENLEEFPLDINNDLIEYYSKIVDRINNPSRTYTLVEYDDRYYIHRIKPFFIENKVYYEVTFTMAYSDTSKFDRIIAFTDIDMLDNYAVKFKIHMDSITILDKEMSILIIDSYETAIRPCELDNFSKILGINGRHNTVSKEYIRLMEFISHTNTPLNELVNSSQDYYDKVKSSVTEGVKVVKIFKLLDRSRNLIISGSPGANILSYLLLKMNNRIIKLQTGDYECQNLSQLYLKNGCIPFEDMPYCTSLIQHNPRYIDLALSIPIKNRKSEFLARYIKNNTEINGKLFTDKEEISNFDNIDDLIEDYNNKIFPGHRQQRSISRYKNYLYINGYVKDSIYIINELSRLSSSGVQQYTESIDHWLSNDSYYIDDEYKRNALRMMFSDSKVALIYGAAGTGKSTLINHISNFWADYNKLFLANTHPAISNLKQNIKVGNSTFKTISSFLYNTNSDSEFDIVVIDECSTVSNNDMERILKKAKFELLVLVGDIYQIESIYFGNWFSFSRKFLPKTCVFELEHPYRTTNDNLLLVWERVRQLDDRILETLVEYNHIKKLNEAIFRYTNKDEIILCLNYDGLYGINNINRFLQRTNPNPEYIWGINTFKIGDPILFNESNKFSPLIHNNSKGKILDIDITDKYISFKVELETTINEIDAKYYDFDLIGISKKTGNSVISFLVNRYRSTDEDDYNDSTVIPFHVAYAISIHKAQGLEYDSVKVILTDETEDKISHNIFYTAITRAKQNLEIYCTPEVGQYIISKFKKKETQKDANLLSNIGNLEILNR